MTLFPLPVSGNETAVVPDGSIQASNTQSDGLSAFSEVLNQVVNQDALESYGPVDITQTTITLQPDQVGSFETLISFLAYFLTGTSGGAEGVASLTENSQTQNSAEQGESLSGDNFLTNVTSGEGMPGGKVGQETDPLSLFLSLLLLLGQDMTGGMDVEGQQVAGVTDMADVNGEEAGLVSQFQAGTSQVGQGLNGMENGADLLEETQPEVVSVEDDQGSLHENATQEGKEGTFFLSMNSMHAKLYFGPQKSGPEVNEGGSVSNNSIVPDVAEGEEALTNTQSLYDPSAPEVSLDGQGSYKVANVEISKSSAYVAADDINEFTRFLQGRSGADNEEVSLNLTRTSVRSEDADLSRLVGRDSSNVKVGEGLWEKITLSVSSDGKGGAGEEKPFFSQERFNGKIVFQTGNGQTGENKLIHGEEGVANPINFEKGLSGIQNPVAASDASKTQDMSPVSRDVLNQIRMGMAQSIRLRQDKAIIQLHPPELGHVKIELTVSGNNHVNASFVAEHPEVKSLLENHLAYLREQLSNNGFTLGECSVDISGQNANGQQPSDYQDNMTPFGDPRMWGVEVDNSAISDEKTQSSKITPFGYPPGRVSLMV